MSGPGPSAAPGREPSETAARSRLVVPCDSTAVRMESLRRLCLSKPQTVMHTAPPLNCGTVLHLAYRWSPTLLGANQTLAACTYPPRDTHTYRVALTRQHSKEKCSERGGFLDGAEPRPGGRARMVEVKAPTDLVAVPSPRVGVREVSRAPSLSICTCGSSRTMSAHAPFGAAALTHRPPTQVDHTASPAISAGGVAKRWRHWLGWPPTPGHRSSIRSRPRGKVARTPNKPRLSRT